MKLVLWIGNDANQRALANKIHSAFPVDGIIIEARINKTRITFFKVITKVFEKLFLHSIDRSWNELKLFYSNKFPDYPKTKILTIENINSEAASEFTKNINPDLIIVSGTRLVKEKMLSLDPKIGIINLHTGLSPYIKGGPNCTNWCIATEQFHLIGNTILWIDKGIDSGDILTAEFTDLHGNESLPEMHVKVMEHAHALYLKAIAYIASGNYSSVKQSDITKGKTYYTKQWTLKEKINLVRNLKKFSVLVSTGEINKLKADVKEIKITL